jgi:hypothetical protein
VGTFFTIHGRLASPAAAGCGRRKRPSSRAPLLVAPPSLERPTAQATLLGRAREAGVDQRAGDIDRKHDPVAALMEPAVLVGEQQRGEELHRRRRVEALPFPRHLEEPASAGLAGIERIHRVSSIVVSGCSGAPLRFRRLTRLAPLREPDKGIASRLARLGPLGLPLTKPRRSR